MIKIVSNHSNFGGSTITLIYLCNFFNERGIPCEFYGPQDWHLSKCKYGKHMNDLVIIPEDRVIGHYRPKTERNCKKSVLYTQEKHTFLLKCHELSGYESIIFSSQSLKDWHYYYKGPQNLLVIPTFQSKLKKVTPSPEGIAGVIGTISLFKQTHISIQRALADGMKKVFLYGDYEPVYFENVIKPLLGDNVIHKGLVDNMQEVYESISCVYHSSLYESASLVLKECQHVGLPFYGNENILDYETWDDDSIFDAWVEVLEY